MKKGNSRWTKQETVPRHIREILINNIQGKFNRREIQNLLNENYGMRKIIIQFAINKSADFDNMTVCSFMLNQASDFNRAKLLNNYYGKYSPLCRACFNLSLRMIKYLTSTGADVGLLNVHNETVFDVLQHALAAEKKRYPLDTVFIEHKYKQCKDFLEQNFISNKKNKTPPPTC